MIRMLVRDEHDEWKPVVVVNAFLKSRSGARILTLLLQRHDRINGGVGDRQRWVRS